MSPTLCYKISLHFATIILTVLSILFVPILILTVIIPIIAFRACVQLLRQTLKPSSGKILTPISAYFAADKIHQDKPLCTNLIHISLQGKVEVNSIRKSLIDNVLMKTDDDGNPFYPELQQYLTKYLGFSFWENDPNFSPDNHLRLVIFPGKDSITEDIYIPFFKSCLNSPFERKRSPWEILIIHNFKEPHDHTNDPVTLVTFRVHHALSGGYSTMNFILDVGQVAGTRAVAKFPRIPLWKKILWNLVFIVRAPYESIWSTLKALDSNDLRLPGKKLSSNKSVAISPPIPVQFIKDIKNGLKVSFSSVISEGIAGGIRNYMIENGMSVPRSIHVMTPWPVQDIPAKLGNFLTGVLMEYPIGLDSPTKRAQGIEKNFNAMKYSTIPRTNYLFMSTIGRVFNFMLKPAHHTAIASTIMSNIAGPNEQLIFLTHPITGMTFASGFICKNIGLGFTVLSYNGFLRIICGADTALLPTDQEAAALLSKILGELQNLKNEVTV
ncbi:unnamed protein product [Allacma fusca]|uniref:O-acyltransferase WSD1 C-terminal domain-containing protein n=1 Tax=Allacma fusca TaxID=39272 RepID=A0A8J2KLK1_9HEXA|nr:unnamed protein product [Allacma fusca]